MKLEEASVYTVLSSIINKLEMFYRENWRMFKVLVPDALEKLKEAKKNLEEAKEIMEKVKKRKE